MSIVEIAENSFVSTLHVDYRGCDHLIKLCCSRFNIQMCMSREQKADVEHLPMEGSYRLIYISRRLIAVPVGPVSYFCLDLVSSSLSTLNSLFIYLFKNFIQHLQSLINSSVCAVSL